MATFTIAFQTQKLMNMLNKAKTPEWENGKAYEVPKLLLKRYKQDDAINPFLPQQLKKQRKSLISLSVSLTYRQQKEGYCIPTITTRPLS